MRKNLWNIVPKFMCEWRERVNDTNRGYKSVDFKFRLYLPALSFVLLVFLIVRPLATSP